MSEPSPRLVGLQLEFPLPSCPYCLVECDPDSAWFRCPACGARWPQAGAHLAPAVRECVECDMTAEVADVDGQPRCRACVAGIAAGRVTPTGPYRCAGCNEQVHGIGFHPQLRPVGARAARCPRCYVVECARAGVLAWPELDGGR